MDTEAKRRSAFAHPVLQVLPPADGNVSAADRQHAAWLYRGVPAAPPATEAIFLQPSYVLGPSR